MELAAIIKDFDQYTPEGHVQEVTRVKRITSETTIKELMDWESTLFPRNPKIYTKETLIPIQIVRMD